jgi:hypothetical protein
MDARDITLLSWAASSGIHCLSQYSTVAQAAARYWLEHILGIDVPRDSRRNA